MAVSVCPSIDLGPDMQNSKDKELTQKAHEMRDFQNKTGSNRTQKQKQRPKHFRAGKKEKRS